MQLPEIDLTAQLTKVLTERKLPGLAAAAWRGDELLALGATGLRKRGGTPVSLDDRWHLGSDTKAMTAALFAIQVDRGKVHFDDTLGSIFGPRVHPAYASITLERLLQHRGGLPPDVPADIWADMWRAGDDPRARLDAVQAILVRPPTQSPGVFAYSNASYIAIGAALELTTGATWEDLMRADLLAPLGMTHAGFGAPTGDSPWGHRKDGGALVPVPPGPHADNPPALGPAGTVHCSLRDWGRFLGVVLAGARGEDTIASREVMKRILAAPPGATRQERYAGGWLVASRDWAGGAALTHAGSNTMWSAIAWLAPARNLAFAAVTNVFDMAATDAALASVIGACGMGQTS